MNNNDKKPQSIYLKFLGLGHESRFA